MCTNLNTSGIISPMKVRKLFVYDEMHINLSEKLKMLSTIKSGFEAGDRGISTCGVRIAVK